MKPDSRPEPGPPRRSDRVGRAHLKDPRDGSHTMTRYEPDAALHDLVQLFWIPIWDVPPGQAAPQRVLQHPVCLVVVASDYARFYGVVPGVSTTTLTGRGWAVGAMLTPAAGFLLARAPVTAFTDRHVGLAELLGADGSRLTERVRAAMAPEPADPVAHTLAMAAFADVLRPLLPLDPEGELVNRVVAFVEETSEVTRVSQVCDRFEMTERSLQRLVARRLGLTPKWLIQRRRLHEAADRLRGQPIPLAELATTLGYADQAHFSRDFSAVTGTTPSRFAAHHAGAPRAEGIRASDDPAGRMGPR